jgi:CDP-ribitol ribitolphosphotransferase
MFLHIVLKNRTGRDIYLHSHGRSPVLLKETPIEVDDESRTEVVINITTAKGRAFLENGKWEIGYYDSIGFPEEKQKCLFTLCNVSDQLAQKLETLDKVFRYNDLTYAYTINFVAYSDDDVNIHLYICSLFMMRNDKYHLKNYISTNSEVRSSLRVHILHLAILVLNIIYFVCSIFTSRKGDKVLFMTEDRTSIEGNLSVLYNKLVNRDIKHKYKTRISARDATIVNSNYSSWLKVVSDIAWADYIFIDGYASILLNLRIRAKTKIIQVWHAGVGFKSVGYARFGKEGSPHPVKSGHRKYEMAIVPSEGLIKIYAEVFGIENEALVPTGMPRLDSFFDEKRIAEFKDEFYRNNPKIKEKKMILFAPTYRSGGKESAYYNYSKLDFDRIHDFCGDKYVFAIKMHPYVNDTKEYFTTTNANISEENIRDRIKPDLACWYPRIVDFTGKYDINDLFHVADILITDYSSVYYEYSLLKRPILFYTYDRQIYETIHGVHQKIKEAAPGRVCDTFDELIGALASEEYEIEKTIAFSDIHFSAGIGGAADRLLDIVLPTA